MQHDDLLARTDEARTAAWRTWGTVDDDVLTHLISPMFAGGPVWPDLRQAFRVVRRPGAVLVASDGLADPSDDPGSPAVNGLGHEFFAATTDPLDRVPGSWLFDLVWQMSQFAAAHAGIAPLLAELTLLSTELHGVGVPESHRDRFVNAAGRVGVLLGLPTQAPPPVVTGPLSDIRLINVVLLTLPELEFVAGGGDGARTELGERLAARGEPGLSTLDRPDVVGRRP